MSGRCRMKCSKMNVFSKTNAERGFKHNNLQTQQWDAIKIGFILISRFRIQIFYALRPRRYFNMYINPVQ